MAQPGRARCQSRRLHVHLGGGLWPSRSGALGAGRSAERPSVPRSGNSTTWAGSGSPRTCWWTQAPQPRASRWQGTRVDDPQRPRRADLGIDVCIDVWGQDPDQHGQVGGQRHRGQRLTGCRTRSRASTSASSFGDSLWPGRRGCQRGACRVGESGSLAFGDEIDRAHGVLTWASTSSSMSGCRVRSDADKLVDAGIVARGSLVAARSLGHHLLLRVSESLCCLVAVDVREVRQGSGTLRPWLSTTWLIHPQRSGAGRPRLPRSGDSSK